MQKLISKVREEILKPGTVIFLAKSSKVRDAVIQRAEMLRAWGNVRYVGCIRSILNGR